MSLWYTCVPNGVASTSSPCTLACYTSRNNRNATARIKRCEKQTARFHARGGGLPLNSPSNYSSPAHPGSKDPAGPTLIRLLCPLQRALITGREGAREREDGKTEGSEERRKVDTYRVSVSRVPRMLLLWVSLGPPGGGGHEGLSGCVRGTREPTHLKPFLPFLFLRQTDDLQRGNKGRVDKRCIMAAVFCEHLCVFLPSISQSVTER